MAEPVLKAARVTKHFRGLTAVDNVTLDLAVGELHAVIGPNGAGKSTLVNVLSGDLAPTSGSIQLDGREVAYSSADERSRLGIGRSYQRTNVFAPFTVLENCRLAAQSRSPHPLNWWRRAASYRSITAAAEQALAAVGLESRAGTIAGTLSHGEQRQLDLAMCLATDPRVLLLDEPLGGTGPQEAARMVRLLDQLRRKHAILLVEHDMDAVFALAQVLTVMVNGAVLACGKPEEIRLSPEVQRAYLGRPETDV